MSKSSTRFATQCQYSAYRKHAVSQRGNYTATSPVHVSREHTPTLEIEGMAHAIFAALAFGAALLALVFMIGSMHAGMPMRDTVAALVCFVAAGMLTKDQLSRAAQYW